MLKALFLLLITVPLLYCAALAAFHFWYRHKTLGARYFRLTQNDKALFLQQLQTFAKVLLPALKVAGKNKPKAPASFRFHDAAFPAASCNQQSLDAAIHFRPKANDIIVATCMKAGTTWLQNIVFEILYKGDGDLSDQGLRHIYAASPWLETGTSSSVSLNNAPLLGASKKRLIKTHLPAALCPWASEAKYIYLARDPAACFNSTRHFLQQLSGPFCPDDADLIDWYLSSDMWWGDWPSHVAGWHQRSLKHTNVLFLDYSSMLADPAHAIINITQHLEVALSPLELDKVIEKTSKAYMAAFEHQFTMAPPTIFSAVEQKGFIGGSRDQVSEADTKRIRFYCEEQLAKHKLSMEKLGF